MIYYNNHLYEGEWKNSKINGQGQYIYRSGAIYEGEWKDNKINGNGKFTF